MFIISHTCASLKVGLIKLVNGIYFLRQLNDISERVGNNHYLGTMTFLLKVVIHEEECYPLLEF